MWNSLIDSLDTDHWAEVPISDKKQSEYQEVHMGRSHQYTNPTTIHYQVCPDNSDMTIAELAHCLPNHDPLKDIGLLEMKFNADKTVILGIDLNGDIVQRK